MDWFHRGRNQEWNMTLEKLWSNHILPRTFYTRRTKEYPPNVNLTLKQNVFMSQKSALLWNTLETFGAKHPLKHVLTLDKICHRKINYTTQIRYISKWSQGKRLPYKTLVLIHKHLQKKSHWFISRESIQSKTALWFKSAVRINMS